MAFGDTLYFVARVRPGDSWAEPARQARTRLGPNGVRIVTTDEVLAEFMTALAGGGASIRRMAVHFVRTVMNHSDFEVVPQSRRSFLNGLDLYERRLDKGYSVVDCISMSVMRDRGITEVLTNDHHFEQEGFTILIRR